MKKTEAEVVSIAAPLELKLARERIAELEVQVRAAKLQAPVTFQKWTSVVRSLAITAALVVGLVAMAHRAILWGWP